MYITLMKGMYDVLNKALVDVSLRHIVETCNVSNIKSFLSVEEIKGLDKMFFRKYWIDDVSFDNYLAEAKWDKERMQFERFVSYSVIQYLLTNYESDCYRYFFLDVFNDCGTWSINSVLSSYDANRNIFLKEANIYIRNAFIRKEEVKAEVNAEVNAEEKEEDKESECEVIPVGGIVKMDEYRDNGEYYIDLEQSVANFFVENKNLFFGNFDENLKDVSIYMGKNGMKPKSIVSDSNYKYCLVHVKLRTEDLENLGRFKRNFGFEYYDEALQYYIYVRAFRDFSVSVAYKHCIDVGIDVESALAVLTESFIYVPDMTQCLV